MFRKGRTEVLKDRADASAAIAVELARDKRFRRDLLAALRHGAIAGERARRHVGPVAAVSRLASDRALSKELRDLSKNLRHARRRVEKKRSHRLRNALLLGSAAAIATPWTRRMLAGQAAKLRARSGRQEMTSLETEPYADADADKPMSRMTKAELIERAHAEGVDVPHDISREEIYAMLTGRFTE